MADRWAASQDGDDLWADSPSPIARAKTKRGSRRRRRADRESALPSGTATRKSSANDADAEADADDSGGADGKKHPTAENNTVDTPSPSSSRDRRGGRGGIARGGRGGKTKENETPSKLNAAEDEEEGSAAAAHVGTAAKAAGSKENSSSSDDDDDEEESSVEYIPIRRIINREDDAPKKKKGTSSGSRSNAGARSSSGKGSADNNKKKNRQRSETTATSRNNAKGRSRGIDPSKFHRSVMGDDHDQSKEDEDDDGDNIARTKNTNDDGETTSSLRNRPPLIPSAASTTTRPIGSPPPTSLSRLRQILSEAQMRIVQNKRREITTQIKIRRAAFRDVTELRTWPLQELALEDLDRLMEVHVGGEGGGGQATMKLDQANSDADVLCSGFASDSSGISTSSIDEPKRACRRSGGGSTGVGRNAGGRPSLDPGEDLSPGKATLRARYAEEFRFERSLRRVGEGETSAAQDGKQQKEEEVGTVVDVGVYKANTDAWQPRRSGPDLTPDSISSTSTSDEAAEESSSAPQPEDFLPPLWCMEPRIFAVEKSAAGKRRYLVGHLGRFLDLYWRKSDSNMRHFYELIREGTPCRLYLDLEFTRAANPEINDDIAEQLVTELIQELSLSLKQLYGFDVDRSAYVDLDSSTPKKFSRHLIVHLPQQSLFVDAPAVGSFIRHVVGRLAEEIATGELQCRRPILAKHLFVHTKERDAGEAPESTPQVGFADDTTCFIDIGVYTRNRLFRLLGSAKYGKPSSAALRIASANAFPFPKGFTNDRFYVPDQENTAGDSNSSSPPSAFPPDLDYEYDDEVDMNDPEIAQFFSSMDWSAHADALALTLVVPPNYSKIKYPLLRAVEEAPDVSRTGRVVASSNGDGSINGGHRVARSFPKSSLGASPFLALDDFISNVLGSRGGAHGSVRAWSLDDSQPNSTAPSYITYHMKDNRFCERIGRQHKSNNVMWTVDLRFMTCQQTCHDPECRAMGFRGEPVDLPQNVQEQVRERLFDYELAALDEQAILEQAKNEMAATTVANTNIGEEISDSFEKALLNLDISGDVKESNEREGDGCITTANVPAGPTIVEDHQDDFDSALNNALMLNPELFP